MGYLVSCTNEALLASSSACTCGKQHQNPSKHQASSVVDKNSYVRREGGMKGIQE